MSFALTKYIYPIEETIVLSETLCYSLDNPRTPEEKEIVKKYIMASLPKDEKIEEYQKPKWIIANESIVQLRTRLTNDDKDSFALKYLTENNAIYYNGYEDAIDLLSSIWIILRFEEDDEFSQLSRDKRGLFGKILMKAETDYTNHFSNASSYCNVLSLLIHDDNDYHGESFLLNKYPYDIFFSPKNYDIEHIINDLYGNTNLLSENETFLDWLYWRHIKDNIIKQSSRLESLITQEIVNTGGGKKLLSQRQNPKEKILHIGNLLYASYQQVINPELMLLLLVSIIEYLLTRNPDYNRFNVEDSINKQFKLKSGILIHNQDKNYCLTQLNKDLNDIYSKRSDIAHGNYKDNYNIEDIISTTYNLFKFIRDIINEYIEDRPLVDFLKDN